MKHYLRAAPVALFAVFAVAQQPSRTPQKAGPTLQDAETLWNNGQYKASNAVFLNIIQREPDNPLYHVRFGRLFLDYGQPAEAQLEFEAALKIKSDDAGAILGTAMAAAQSYAGNAATLARKALEADPKLVEAQELLARLALEDNNNAEAQKEAHKALEMDPHTVQARAILAAMDWLADKKETEWDPHDARGYETVAHFFMINRRYDESIVYYRKALELNPNLYPARAELGIRLMQLSQSDEAFQQLKTCFDNEFAPTAVKNSLKLLDKYSNYITFKRDNFILKLHKKEAGVLEPYFESEMKRTIADYQEKYQYKVVPPIQIEAYPDHDDFAVRTLGMPGFGALGVTFNTSIAMDSPSGRSPGSFHWASTLRHEMSHVFTLSMTNSHVPRWFTEGIAVHEETASSPEWGDRLGPEEITAIKEGKLLPIAELDRGFIHPKYPQQVVVSYFQGGKVVDYITSKWGWETILAMLHDFSSGAATADVIRKELKIEPAEFDKQFLALIDKEAGKTVANFTKWKDGVKHVAELAKAKDDDGVIKDGLAVRDLYPDYVEEGSVYEFLAHAYMNKGDKPKAIAELETYVHNGGRSPDSIKLLAKELAAAGQKKEAADILDRLNYIYPVDDELHKRLGELWLDQGKTAGAIREFKVEVAGKPIDPAQAHFDLARAYNLDHDVDRAKDELFLALEIAPGFKPAQKLLLQLSEGGGDAPVVKK